MSFALLSEVWKPPQEIKKSQESFDNISISSTKKLVENKELDGLAYQYYQDFIPDEDEDEDEGYETDDELDHIKVLNHIQNCKTCQSKIKVQNNISDEVLDMLLYTITGIFILFLLDIVLRLGKNLK